MSFGFKVSVEGKLVRCIFSNRESRTQTGSFAVVITLDYTLLRELDRISVSYLGRRQIEISPCLLKA
jgi:hypothetical protein